MMKKLVFVIAVWGIFTLRAESQTAAPISIVPFPKSVQTAPGVLTLKPGATVGYRTPELRPAAELLRRDFHTLYRFDAGPATEAAAVMLGVNPSLAADAYTLHIGDRIVVEGGSYPAVCMGVTSLLQLARPTAGQQLTFPKVTLADEPASAYRGVMLDVARQWNPIQTVKQVVDLCRWYKMEYLQLHLTDDQLFTFPSQAFPQLASEKHYTLDELKDLVEYARVRGVTLIPEFDAPGHTSAMRRAMPDLFGHPDLGVLNMTDEWVYQAMDTLIREMIEVFYTSPYFHIGADEAWLGEFEKLAATDAYVAEKGFDNAHDVYLDFIVRMHKIVKKYGKKTLVWESFPDRGSRKVVVPQDLIVFAWETAYQRPESLLKNGYTLINASWKPAYVTPGLRWEPEYIYHWNIHRWENHWYTTPAYLHPIQLDTSIPIFGGQLCAWEMAGEQIIPSLHQRVPAMSEVLWNDSTKRDYADFRNRYRHTDAQYNRLIFPVAVEKEGFTEPDYEGIYLNRENQFGSRASVRFTPLLPGTRMTYTTDGTTPTAESPVLPETLILDNDFVATLGVFDAAGEMVGYKAVRYERNAIVANITGDTLPLSNVNIQHLRTEFIEGVTLAFENLRKGSVIRYTTDGRTPSATDEVYAGPIAIRESMTVKAVCFDGGVPFGKMYESEFVKKDYEQNVTTGKHVYSPTDVEQSGNIDKVVDGFVDGDIFWDASGPASVVVDLGEATPLRELVLFTYWDDHRFYAYDVELSVDGHTWNRVIDRSQNTEKATREGYRDRFPQQRARYIRVNMRGNSANPSMHIVELRAY